MSEAHVANRSGLKYWRGPFFSAIVAIAFAVCLFRPAAAQPGGCYPGTWAFEECREVRTSLIRAYRSDLEKLDGLIRRNPADANLLYLRAKVYTAMMFSSGLGFKNVEFDGTVFFADIDKKAIADLTRAIDLSPRPIFFAERGMIYAKYWESEYSRYQVLGEGLNTDEEIMRHLDRLYASNQDFKNAERDFLKVLDLSPDSETAENSRDRLSIMRESRGNWLASHQRVAALIASTPLADLALADLDFGIERTKISTEKYRWGIEPLQSAWLAKATAAKRFARDDVALKALAGAEQLQEKDSLPNCRIYLLRAGIRLKRDQIAAALRDLTFAIENNPDCKNLYAVRGDVNQGAGDLRAAVEDYSKVIDSKSPHLTSNTYWKRGKAYNQLGEVEKALSDFTRAIGSSSLCEQDYQIRARAFRLAGNEEAARADEERAARTVLEQKKYRGSDFCSHHTQIPVWAY